MFKTQINQRETVKRIQTRMKIHGNWQKQKHADNRKQIHTWHEGLCEDWSFAPLEFNHLWFSNTRVWIEPFFILSTFMVQTEQSFTQTHNTDLMSSTDAAFKSPAVTILIGIIGVLFGRITHKHKVYVLFFQNKEGQMWLIISPDWLDRFSLPPVLVALVFISGSQIQIFVPINGASKM